MKELGRSTQKMLTTKDRWSELLMYITDVVQPEETNRQKSINTHTHAPKITIIVSDSLITNITIKITITVSEIQKGTYFLSCWAIFYPFTPLKAWKIKISKSWKNILEISFYTHAPKIMIICHTVPVNFIIFYSIK